MKVFNIVALIVVSALVWFYVRSTRDDRYMQSQLGRVRKIDPPWTWGLTTTTNDTNDTVAIGYNTDYVCIGDEACYAQTNINNRKKNR